jgi:RNA polymerase sigma factor (sigma-70 family)
MAKTGNRNLRTSEDLVAGLRNLSDDRAWRQFWDEYGRLLWAEARQAGLETVECEEVVQDTLLTVARGIAHFRYNPAGPGFRMWLRAIARSRIIDQARKKKREQRLFVPETEAICERLRERTWKTSGLHSSSLTPGPLEPATDARGDAGWDASEPQAEAEAYEVLDHAISQLRQQANPWHFQVFQHLLQGQKPREVSRDLGVSRMAVYLIKKRLQRKLKDLVHSAAPPPG